MNALKGQVSSDLDDLVNKTDSPFTISVNSFPLPQKFRMPQIESYDEVKDPLDHLETFKTLMHLQGVPNEIMCRAFPTMLKGPARIWFSILMPNSINTFKELSAQVQKIYSVLNEHQAARRRDVEILHNLFQQGGLFN